MANKLQKVFKKKGIVYKGTIRFKDKNTAKDFNDTIKKVYDHGDTIRLDGDASMSWGVDSGLGILPLEDFDEVSEITIGPSLETIEIPIEVDGKEEAFAVHKYFVKDGFVIETPKGFLFETKMSFNDNTQAVNLRFTPHLREATSISVALEDIKRIQSLIDFCFKDNDNKTNRGLNEIKRIINEYYYLYDGLFAIEEMLDISFKAESIDLNDSDSNKDLFELCLVAREKKAIRVSAKMASMEYVEIQEQPNQVFDINGPLFLTFRSSMQYSIWGENVELHCAFYLGNAVVKKIEKQEDGKKRIIYGDSETAPMYMAYKGFITEEAAEEELKSLIYHKEEYENALSVEQYYSGRLKNA